MKSLVSPAAAGDVKYLIDIAEEERVCRRLDFIYSRIPMNNCLRCADCCFNSPQVHLIEFLNIYEELRTRPELKQRHLAHRLVEYEILNLTTLKNKCPFLTRHGCDIYKRRPLQCRLFGLYPADEYGDIVSRCRRQNEELAGYYARVKKLALPKEVMTYDIEQCENNIDAAGNVTVIAAGERARLNEQIYELSREVLPPTWAAPGLVSLANRYVLMHIDDNGLEDMKVRAIREFQKTGASPTLDKLLAHRDWRF